MNVQATEAGDVITIAIEGDIEMITMKGLKEQLMDIVEKNDKDIVVDFSRVGYLDSSGIGILLAIAKNLKTKNRSLKLSNLSERISRVLELSSLADMIS